MQAGEKPRAAWRIGTEHEKLVYFAADHHAPSYEEKGGIHALLIGLTRYGWTPVMEGDNIIALAGPDGNVSLEPAGQLELSGAPLVNLHQTCAETGRHLEQVKEVGEALGIGFLGPRHVARQARATSCRSCPRAATTSCSATCRGSARMGLDMMLRTCTIQTNLDYSSEADMVKKFRTSLALQPLATALFANSPFTEGKPNGFLSYRSHIWSDTDPHRTGMLPFVFEDGFGYERYVDYMLDVPMYFVFRDGKYIDAAGHSFRDFLAGKLPVLPGELPTAERLGRSPFDRLSRSAAQVVSRNARRGRRARGTGSARCRRSGSGCCTTTPRSTPRGTWSSTGRSRSTSRCARGAAARARCTECPRGGTLHELAGRVLAIAAAGLSARARLDAAGDNEVGFLAPLRRDRRQRQSPRTAPARQVPRRMGRRHFAGLRRELLSVAMIGCSGAARESLQPLPVADHFELDPVPVEEVEPRPVVVVVAPGLSRPGSRPVRAARSSTRRPTWLSGRPWRWPRGPSGRCRARGRLHRSPTWIVSPPVIAAPRHRSRQPSSVGKCGGALGRR